MFSVTKWNPIHSTFLEYLSWDEFSIPEISIHSKKNKNKSHEKKVYDSCAGAATDCCV